MKNSSGLRVKARTILNKFFQLSTVRNTLFALYISFTHKTRARYITDNVEKIESAEVTLIKGKISKGKLIFYNSVLSFDNK